MILKVKSFVEVPKDYTGLVNNKLGTTAKFFNGNFHCLDGPATWLSTREQLYNFYLYGQYYTESEFWKQPEVVNEKLRKILNSEI